MSRNHDIKCCFGLFNIQKSWSISDALYLEDVVSNVISEEMSRVSYNTHTHTHLNVAGDQNKMLGNKINRQE